mgnify:CR=1 FL=1
MKWMLVLFVIIFRFQHLIGQVNYIETIDSFSNNDIWNKEIFLNLKNQMIASNYYNELDGFDSLYVDSAFLFKVDPLKIYGTVTKGSKKQLLYSISADSNFFSLLKSELTRDSIFEIHYTLITDLGREQFVYKDGSISIINSAYKEYVINPLGPKAGKPLIKSSSFKVIVDTNYRGEEILSIKSEYLTEPLLSFHLEIKNKICRVVYFQPTDKAAEKGVALFMKFIYGKISFMSNYLYIDIEHGDDKNFTGWVQSEFSELLTRKGDVALENCSDKLLIPYGISIFFSFLGTSEVNTVPLELYNSSKIGDYQE